MASLNEPFAGTAGMNRMSAEVKSRPLIALTRLAYHGDVVSFTQPWGTSNENPGAVPPDVSLPVAGALPLMVELFPFKVI
jgi:hypothetical protein